MFTVKEKEFETLDQAMAYAKTVPEFVVIKGADYEICGKFGVDSIKDSILPDGSKYEWKMRRDNEPTKSWRKIKS